MHSSRERLGVKWKAGSDFYDPLPYFCEPPADKGYSVSDFQRLYQV